MNAIGIKQSIRKVVTQLRLAERRDMVRREIHGRMPGVLHSSQRSVSRLGKGATLGTYTKSFHGTENSQIAQRTEIEALAIFGDRPWTPDLLAVDGGTLTYRELPSECRLDRIAPQLSTSERSLVARDLAKALFEVFDAGYAHCDVKAPNVFWVDEQLIIIDWETMQKYPAASDLPPFPGSYDLSGQGLDSPFHTGNMHYGSSDPESIQAVLGIELEDALKGVQDMLATELEEASLQFQTATGRHKSMTHRTYVNINTPHLVLAGTSAQRDVARRFEQFKITEDILSGSSLLDLGCHIGGMTFHALSNGVSNVTGVEFDPQKVRVARRVARYSGLNQVTFRQADVDQLTAEDLPGPFDIVFCLAIDTHVADRDHMFDLLEKVCGDRLYFEGNAGTDPDDVVNRLEARGFESIEKLGDCDDDVREGNNRRPLVSARKPTTS